MSNSLLGEDPASPQPSIEQVFAKAAERRKRITYLAIPVTIGVGLLVAIIYIGGRMVTAKPHAPAPVVTASVPAAVPAPAPVEPAKVDPPKTQPPSPQAPAKPAVEAAKPTLDVKKQDAPIAKVVPPATPAPKPAAHKNAPLTLITPRAGETYLQLAAFTPRTILTYLDGLRAGGLEPSVAPGPTPDILRVLVGPFPDSEALSKAKARLDAEKIEWIIRAY